MRNRIGSGTIALLAFLAGIGFLSGANAQSITVTSPNGGESWPEGVTRSITWTSTGLTGNVRIYLYSNWTKLRTLGTTTAASGSWIWNIPADETPRMDARIRVQSLVTTSISDYSDGMFTLGTPSITVLSPNGGESLVRGTGNTLSWRSAGIPGDFVLYLYDGWTKLRTLATVPAASGTATLWPIPAAEIAGNNYRIRVQSKSYTTFNDYSDAVFAIGDTGQQTILLPGGVPLEMVWIPAGTFLMGRYSAEQDSFADEDPQHQVTFASGFWMGKYEVTQAQWVALMGSNPSNFSGNSLPVEQVSWEDTQGFLAALNTYTGLTFHLPSEAQWEYAARAGQQTRFYWGDDPSYTQIASYAWYSGNSVGTSSPVGKKLPNAFGLYDMSGNVWEWCQDWYHSSYTGAPTDGSAWLNPVGTNRQLRGGTWNFYDWACRSARHGNSALPSYSDSTIGFRLCR